MRLRRSPAASLLAALLLASCAGGNRMPRVSDTAPKIGTPYVVGGRTYVPRDDRHYDEIGYASWYGGHHRGRPTANGERFDPDGISAAHTTLPLPSYVEVTALDTGRTILVRINDRGPFVPGRIIDLSHGAAKRLGIDRQGLARVRVRRVEPDEQARAALRAGRPAAPSRIAAPPPPPATPPQQAAWGDYIQIAALSDEARANRLAAELGDIGTSKVVPGGGLYRVRIGPIAADRLASALARARARGYQDARIVRDPAR
jgi:rare lipoprotein A